MRKAPLLILLFLCLIPLSAQGPNDVCGLVGGQLGPNCDNVAPGEVFGLKFCEYRIRSDGAQVPIQNDPVKWGQIVRTGSGYHPHLGNPDNRPMYDIEPTNDGQTQTGLDGCFPVTLTPGGFSGGYVISASGTDPQTLQSRLAGAHWLVDNPFNPGVPVSLPSPSGSIIIRYDSWHAYTPGDLNTAYVIFDTLPSWVNLANIYSGLTSLYLDVIRCSLHDGGDSDNDAGTAVIDIPGNWTYRTFESHDAMRSCDIYNHSLDGDDPTGARFTALGAGVIKANCQYGDIMPQTGTTPISEAFWITQKNVHISCGASPLFKNPKGPVQ